MTKKSKALLYFSLFFIIASLLPVNAFGYPTPPPPPLDGFFVTAKAGHGWYVYNGDYTYTKNDDGSCYCVQTVWWWWMGVSIILEFDYASWWDLEYVLIDATASNGQPKLYIKYVNEQWTTIQIILHNGYNAVRLDSSKLVEKLQIVTAWPHSLQVDYVGVRYTE